MLPFPWNSPSTQSPSNSPNSAAECLPSPCITPSRQLPSHTCPITSTLDPVPCSCPSKKSPLYLVGFVVVLLGRTHVHMRGIIMQALQWWTSTKKIPTDAHRQAGLSSTLVVVVLCYALKLQTTQRSEAAQNSSQPETSNLRVETEAEMVLSCTSDVRRKQFSPIHGTWYAVMATVILDPRCTAPESRVEGAQNVPRPVTRIVVSRLSSSLPRCEGPSI